MRHWIFTMRHRSSDIQHSSFNIQHSSLSFNIQVLNWTSRMNGWPFETNPLLKSVGRKESRKHKRHRSLHGSTSRMDSNATNARSELRCVAEQLLYIHIWGPLVYQFYYCYMLRSLNKVLLTYYSHSRLLLLFTNIFIHILQQSLHSRNIFVYI